MTRPIGQRGDEPAPGAGRLLPAVGLLCGVACLLPLAGVGLMTVGIDEAWNLLGYRDAARGVAAPLADISRPIRVFRPARVAINPFPLGRPSFLAVPRSRRISVPIWKRTKALTCPVSLG